MATFKEYMKSEAEHYIQNKKGCTLSDEQIDTLADLIADTLDKDDWLSETINELVADEYDNNIEEVL